MKNLIALIFGFYFILNSFAFAQTKGNIHPNIKLSFTERVRLVTWDNAITLSDDANASNSFNRTRTTLMGQWFPNDSFEFALKFTNEFRYYFAPTGKEFEMNEIIFDQLYVRYKNKIGTVTLGRQNIILGEGFVVMDGHPLDGSRSIYFNAARFDLNITKNNKVSLFYTYQPETDNILPEINQTNQKLIEQPEHAVGAYFTSQLNDLNLQAYYIFKKIDDTDKEPIDSKIHTVGSRFKIPLNKNFTLTGEGAYQLGKYGELDRIAFGGYGYADYSTLWKSNLLPKTFSVGGIFLSGDDPTTEKVETWDPLFSRWPKWSESYIYTLIIENGGKVAYWSNLASVYGKIKFDFDNDLKLGLDYHHLFAPEESVNKDFTVGTGSNRGDLLIAKLSYKINKNITGHLVWESFTPGDFYSDGADGYNWARVEFLLKI